ncbi:MAG TPA: hypothetical protein VN649_00285 [Ramlibacter sp.]|nr:hypothetical protein [Ramlibacter sp.]
MSEQHATSSGELDAAPVSARPTESAGQFDGNSTAMFQAKMKRAPAWFCSFLAGNRRESLRLHDELALMKGAWPLLMKQRNGGKWTAEDKAQLKAMIRSASSVSPYLFIWALPGSVVLLPFMAWYLDRQRKGRTRKNVQV